MIYDVLHQSDRELGFVTHHKARRGRGVLFATAPLVIYVLAISVLFALSVQDLSLWEQVKQAASWGLGLASILAVGCFVLGYRIRDQIEAGPIGLSLRHTPAIGPVRTTSLPWSQLRGFAVDPSLRSLGADVLLVAVHEDGRRLPLAEGEPHSPQVRDLARQLARLSGLALEPPKYGPGAAQH
jgi:hypothetical protein